MREPEHFDVLIVGAGISGIGTACYLLRECPGKTFVLLEGRDDFGGTWDLFRYPGIRSDSDMHTLGYSFKPWEEAKAIADGPSIKRYLEETIEEHGVGPHIRYQHLVKSASWSSETGRWTVHAERKDTGERATLTCGFLSICSGYYSYKQGYRPEIPGLERFRGPVVHPQEWPEDLDYAGKRVVVIGSGATAMTLVPAMAADAGHVTMLQRSPTYVVSYPDRDAIANALRKILPARVAYAITRTKNIWFQQYMYRQTRTKPEKVKKKLLDRVRKELGRDYDVEKHFTPCYNPWDQRLCLVPNSDLFEAIRSGKASVVTDLIDTVTETGIRLRSGEELEADILITATGLELVVLGEMVFTVDGEPVDFSRTWTYKGLMYSQVPNLMSTFGYINASWTLRADLTAEYLCRLLGHLDATGTRVCTPRLRASDADMPERPWIDDFSSGYMQRKMHLFPRQGDRAPWLNPQNYTRDKQLFREEPLDDGCMVFSNPVARATSPTADETVLQAVG
ncbi:MAG TPA: NAD(P)/FAD-dependent oxidoreductase [Thermoanaerobaculia bacterium]|nr:NAD(P)/FAD-dependent oxidoreductase [Thermoanaerobaculia bacterium]